MVLSGLLFSSILWENMALSGLSFSHILPKTEVYPVSFSQRRRYTQGGVCRGVHTGGVHTGGVQRVYIRVVYRGCTQGGVCRGVHRVVYAGVYLLVYMPGVYLLVYMPGYTSLGTPCLSWYHATRHRYTECSPQPPSETGGGPGLKLEIN